MPLLTVDKATPDELHQMLVAVVSVSKKGFVAMGKILRELKKKEVYKKAVGQGIDTWSDYLKQPEIGLSAGEANRLIQIYDEFIVRLGYDEETIAQVPIKNMHYLLPMVKKMKSKEESDELIADATLLSQKDFKERMFDKRVEGGDTTRTFEYLIMRRTVETGALDKVPGIESDTIKVMFNLE